ncbi:MAG: SDR family NAD(P)-dependent oxidoreductase [Syntrophobacteraceae bacterium]
MKLTFSGPRVLLLGGSCDLALCLAGPLIEEGLFPILTWRSEEGKRRISEGLRGREGAFGTAYLDFAERKKIESFFAQIGEELDSLVDFIQGDFEGFIGSSSPDSIHRYFSENIASRAEFLRAAARLMLKKRQGRMVFISSAAAARSNPGQGFYAGAKLASEALYRNLGIELASRGVTTVTLRPGYIDAGRGAGYLRKNAGVHGRTPTGRVLSPEEVAQAVVFFLSENSAAFNATELMMDGGLTAMK